MPSTQTSKVITVWCPHCGQLKVTQLSYNQCPNCGAAVTVEGGGAKYCVALNRDIRGQQECRKVQRDLPTHFCRGCTWFENLYVLRKKYHGVKRDRVEGKKAILLAKQSKAKDQREKEKIDTLIYRVEGEVAKRRAYKLQIPAYLREWLIKIALRRGMNVNQLIVKLLREVREGMPS